MLAFCRNDSQESNWIISEQIFHHLLSLWNLGLHRPWITWIYQDDYGFFWIKQGKSPREKSHYHIKNTFRKIWSSLIDLYLFNVMFLKLDSATFFLQDKIQKLSNSIIFNINTGEWKILLQLWDNPVEPGLFSASLLLSVIFKDVSVGLYQLKIQIIKSVFPYDCHITFALQDENTSQM